MTTIELAPLRRAFTLAKSRLLRFCHVIFFIQNRLGIRQLAK